MLKSVLRTHAQGADTIVWLADRRPPQEAAEAIWFDRKERPVHIYGHTPMSAATGVDLVNELERCLAGVAPATPAVDRHAVAPVDAATLPQ
jgi:hypothetical protein